MNAEKCKRPKRVHYPPVGFIAVYGNVPTRRATTVSTSTTLKYRAYRSFHRRFCKRVSRNRSIKKKGRGGKRAHRCLSVRDIAQCRPRVGSINGVPPFIFCPSECRTTRFGTYTVVTFVHETFHELFREGTSLTLSNCPEVGSIVRCITRSKS